MTTCSAELKLLGVLSCLSCKLQQKVSVGLAIKVLYFEKFYQKFTIANIGRSLAPFEGTYKYGTVSFTKSQDVSKLTSQDVLSKELQLIIKNLYPGTKEIENANAIQKANIYK
uniref:Uncharacterized protein n=1 Tax=Rhizophagus irregularis (strain DAOM 181602 / DAOM 197198 / MUCL 43194) TaxID=747089 RepID=U9TPY1_RHIID